MHLPLLVTLSWCLQAKEERAIAEEEREEIRRQSPHDDDQVSLGSNHDVALLLGQHSAL
jgi:hypothetical protein|eukprot:COSAG02_NODE_2146_length_9670_cov_7.714136_5_plen_59_part_00